MIHAHNVLMMNLSTTHKELKILSALYWQQASDSKFKSSLDQVSWNKLKHDHHSVFNVIKEVCTIPLSFSLVNNKVAPSTKRNIEPDENTWLFSATKK